MSCMGSIPSAWQGGGYLPVEACCQTWIEACEGGTDSEGYGRLVGLDDGAWTIGCGLPSPRFCPWCGARAPEAPRDPRSERK